MWSPLVGDRSATESDARHLALDLGDVDGADSLREALSHFEKLQFTADVAAMALDATQTNIPAHCSDIGGVELRRAVSPRLMECQSLSSPMLPERT